MKLSWNMDADGVAQIFTSYNFEGDAKNNPLSVADIFRNKVHAGGAEAAREEQIYYADLFSQSPRMLGFIVWLIESLSDDDCHDVDLMEMLYDRKKELMEIVSSINADLLIVHKQCDICGDHHAPDEIPRECETGDGV